MAHQSKFPQSDGRRSRPVTTRVRLTTVRWSAVIAVVAAAMLLVPKSLSGHNLPSDTKVWALFKPEGRTLHVVVRVAVDAMRTVKWPGQTRPDSVPTPPFVLDLAGAKKVVQQMADAWVREFLHIYEGDQLLSTQRVVAARISLPDDRSLESYDKAVANVTGPALPDSMQLASTAAQLDMVVEYEIASDRSVFSVAPEFARLSPQTQTVLRFLPPSGGERAYQYLGNPGRVQLDPRWFDAAAAFAKMGFLHILDGFDHLLFICALVIPFRRFRPLLLIITSFTIAHSITLIASAFGFVPSGAWFPPLIEALIALSILVTAVENIIGAKIARRWLIAFGFGLVHGFGFSFALSDSLQFAGRHLVTSLLSFNVGVELGQMLVLALLVPVLVVTFKYVTAERVGTIILSALVAHVAWHWFTPRLGALSRYPFVRPELNMSLAMTVARGTMVVLTLGALVWGGYSIAERFRRRREPVAAAGD